MMFQFHKALYQGVIERHLSDRDLQWENNHEASVRRDIADLIRDACVNVGFFYGARLSILRPSLSLMASCIYQ